MTRRDPSRTTVVIAVTVVIVIASVASWSAWIGPRRAAAAASREPQLAELRATTRSSLARVGIDLNLAQLRATDAVLRWRAPSDDCVELYRIRIDERYRDANVARFVGREEEHSTQYLALAADPRRRTSGGLTPVLGLLLASRESTALDEAPTLDEAPALDEAPDTGLEALDEAPRIRELWWGPTEVGPLAPDWTCRRRSWDPLEDALAFGWPRLPGRSQWVGERWVGAAVEGRCHETPCVNPEGGFDHLSPCRARPWAERLVAVEDELAVVLGDWDDGHGSERAEIGILTARELVIDEGRPLQARAVIDQRWVGVRRELSLVRVDECGSRSLAGLDHGDDTPARLREQIRARLSPPPRP